MHVRIGHIIVLLLSSSPLFAQFNNTKPQKALQASDVVAVQEQEVVKEHELYKVEKLKIQSASQPRVTLKNVQYKTVTLDDKKIKLPKDLNVKTYVSIERKQAIAFAFVPQYVLAASGQVKKIVSYELDVQESRRESRKTTGNRVYAAQSVLASGSWHKISISEQGILN